MNARPSPSARRPLAAFTVVELLVAVSVLTLIVVVLYSLFDNTQRAMRSNAAQVDVMEGGRAAIELIARDLERMTDQGLPGAINFYVGSWGQPLLQSLPGPTNVSDSQRMNFQQELFFTSRFNKQGTGTGYRVVPGTGVGSLYRFVTNVPVAALRPYLLSSNYFRFANTNSPEVFQRITDGVVHFRVTALDSDGRRIEPYAPMVNRQWTNRYAGLWVTNELNTAWPRYMFTNTVVPAAVEIELGIVEPYILERYRSMAGNRSVASNYLARQAAHVQMFRQQVPVRSAPPLRPVP
jgi:type II secretory pathway pseudopilin PulG